MHTYVHVYTSELCIRTRACVHTCMHTCMHAYIRTTCNSIYIHARMHAYMHTYLNAYTQTCIPACKHACMHASIHARDSPRYHFHRLREKREGVVASENWPVHLRVGCRRRSASNQKQSPEDNTGERRTNTSASRYNQNYISIRTYIHTYMHACVHTLMHACLHTFIHTCILTYRPACMHACIDARDSPRYHSHRLRTRKDGRGCIRDGPIHLE